MSKVLGGIVDIVKKENNIEFTCDQISKEISCKSLTFLQFVESLEEVLTSVDKNVRLNGIKALVTVIEKIPVDFFMPEELDYISTFLCERFIDHHSFVPSVLIGIECTIQMKHVSKEMIIRYFNVIMPHFHCQSQLHKDRNTFYRILHQVFLNHLDDVRIMGPDFLYCVISSMDGERDPTNLALLFRILPQFFCNYPLGHLAEEAFDVIACYFPIDFRETDESKVNRNDLATNLARCLSCTEDFADFCIPLALQKLEASLKVAKLDSLYLLKLCCENFSSTKIIGHIEEIWRILKIIILSDNDDTSTEVREAAISVLTALLYSTAIIKGDDSNEQLSNFLDLILKSSDRFLLDAQTSFFMPSIKLLCSVGMTSKYACARIAKKIYLIFLDKSDLSQTEIPHIIEALGLITNMCLQMDVELSSIPSLENRWEEICCMFLFYAQNDASNIKITALKALRLSTKFLSMSQRRNYYSVISELIKSDVSSDVRNETLSCLKETAKYFTDEVMTTIIDSNISILDKSDDIETKSKYLNTLCCLGSEHSFFTLISETLCKNICNKQEYTQLALKYMRQLCDNIDCTNLLLHFSKEEGLFNYLLMFWINGIINCSKSEVYYNEIILENLSYVINHIVQTLNSNQYQIFQRYIEYFNDIKNSQFIYKELSSIDQEKYSYLIILLESILNSLNPNIEIQNVTIIVRNCIEISTHTKVSLSSLFASRLAATLINKYFNGDEYDVHLHEYNLILENTLKSSNLCKEKAINQISWITKALVLKGHSKMFLWLDWLIDLLENPEYGKIASTGFQMLATSDSQYLNIKCFCSVRLLYRQRVFCHTIEPLILKYNTLPEPIKENYLLSILYQMEGLSYVTLSPYFSKGKTNYTIYIYNTFLPGSLRLSAGPGEADTQ
ncbi:MMS19 nucleotide excision repair protein homolog isoform X2 [Adelges cooleyi]|uniref:MMS19 nucleotide excision repair protein homolog isoform X2 n=1 Tax=Adelges cooleyi TaxID=133065 RepID=UPI00217F7FA7|nr:MMS19 nucleotide excision repair protein homolog isoform X2 [Adelges cooleyi]